MAWRIDEQLVRGEIDNRERGRVKGRLWFVGMAEPVRLDLQGNAWRDVAGHLIRFTNPRPKAGPPDVLKGFAPVQRGVVGDITASRKVKVPDCSMEEVMRLIGEGKRFPWHWGNSLYLEWHSERNGRVVIESATFAIEIDPDASWRMSKAEEARQQEENGRALTTFVERAAVALEAEQAGKDTDDESEDEPTTRAEETADAEQARMDLLLDRVQARMSRAEEAGEKPDFEKVLDEERARLRRERGEPEPEPATPEEEAERAAWIEEMNAAAEEALQEMEEEKWKNGEEGDGFRDERWHPLVERCNALTHRLLDQTKARGWLGDEEGREHPLREVVDGVMIAGGKLAGALGTVQDAEDWPPDPLCAGSTLTRLKKARGHLRDALAGLDAADEQDLADVDWRREVREETMELLAEVQRLIREVRAVLKLSEEGGGGEG